MAAFIIGRVVPFQNSTKFYFVKLLYSRGWGTRPRGNCTQTCRLETGHFQMRQSETTIYHVLNLKSQIKLIFNTVQPYNFDINEFNLTYEVQNIAKGAFQIAPFPNGRFECNCLWALSTYRGLYILIIG